MYNLSINIVIHNTLNLFFQAPYVEVNGVVIPNSLMPNSFTVTV